ncbi:restriction endonuclease subunit S [Variovorax sp. PMC12]|uniref:restriction endonuclease subunit S n=1 Tax=Variovorax sp. PMC12 TaxID=2126319 RepID=UPI00131C3803|nr:restriction endonuclease subunit S [Variovorax sp. PMC12]
MSEFEITPESLPSSWVVTNLGSVVDYGKTAKAEPSEIPGDAWVLELEDIEKDSSRILGRVTQSQRQSRSTKNRFNAGDVLYGKLRPYLNKVVIADEPGFCSTEIVPLSANPALDNRYLFHWLKHPAFLKYVEAASHGMNMPRLGTEAGRSAPLVVAPRREQTRIADQLDTLLARIQACNDSLDAIPALLNRFRQAVLQAAVSGEMTIGKEVGTAATTHQLVTLGEETLRIPSSWQVIDLGQAIDPARPLCYGVVQPGAEVSKGVPLIRVQDMEAGSVLESQLRTVSSEVDREYRRSRVVGGEVLISVVGTIGRTAVVPAGMKANIARAVARLACRDGVLNLWLHYWLSTESIQWHLLRSAKEVARKTLNLADLARIPLALPSPEEQALIVNRVLALFALADAIEARHAAAIALVQRLTPLTLAKAFRGELVQQDSYDEPASALLARITAHSATAPVTETRAPRRGRPPRAPKEAAAMTKSRQDDDVMNQPYLAGHLRRIGSPASAEVLFKLAELPVADFYKQLAWEVAEGHVKDNQTTLEPSHAAG